MHRGSAAEGPVTYANVALDGDRVLACTQLGVYLYPMVRPDWRSSFKVAVSASTRA